MQRHHRKEEVDIVDEVEVDEVVIIREAQSLDEAEPHDSDVIDEVEIND